MPDHRVHQYASMLALTKHPQTKLFRLGAIFCTFLIVYLSLRSIGSLPRSLNFNGADKIGHFTAYFVYTFLLLGTEGGWHGASKKYARLALFAAILFGLFMETLQLTLSTGRHFDILDILANITGSLTAYIGFLYLTRKNH